MTISKNNKSRYFREQTAVTVWAFQNLLYKGRVILDYLRCCILFTKIHSFNSAICFTDTTLFTFFPFRQCLFHRYIIFQTLYSNFHLGGYFERRWRQDSLRKIPKFHLISWCGNFVEKHRVFRVLGDSAEPLRKLSLSTKIPHQEIR